MPFLWGEIMQTDLLYRRNCILDAARKLFEQKGIECTTMSEIVQKAGIKRGALYRIFPNKDALTEAFLEDYVKDFVDCFFLWEESRDIKDVRSSVRDFIKTFRLILFENTQFRMRTAHHEQTDIYLKLFHKSIENLTQAFIERTYTGYKQRREVEIVHVKETFYIMTAGMVMFVKAYPEIDNEILIDIVIQTLRLRDD